MFYDRILNLCKNRGLTVNGLLVKLGMSKSNAKSWRLGAVPQTATLKKIADFFEVDIDTLTNDPEPQPETMPRDEMLRDLCRIYQQLSSINKARLLIYANDLLP